MADCRFIFDQLDELGTWKGNLRFDPTLARGLDYYTGAIFEVGVDELDMGSIGGGGRYDDLTGIFGMEGVSGVGISFGAERIYEVMEELELFPEESTERPDLLFAHFGEGSMLRNMELADELREDGFRVDVYPDEIKLKKQMRYADQCGARFVAMIGEDELEKRTVALRDMESGDQSEIPQSELKTHLLQNLQKDG